VRARQACVYVAEREASVCAVLLGAQEPVY
jgi:hypothetical protein